MRTAIYIGYSLNPQNGWCNCDIPLPGKDKSICTVRNYCEYFFLIIVTKFKRTGLASLTFCKSIITTTIVVECEFKNIIITFFYPCSINGV